MKNNISKIATVLFLIAFSFGFYRLFISAAQTMAHRLNGQILLQVENNGEAWYIYPINEERYYLGRPDDAFDIMRNLGIGISNKDIEKIPLAVNLLNGTDTDGDGLSDSCEEALGTDKLKKDTDGDGFSDKEEVLSEHNPLGQGFLPIDNDFTRKQSGKILIQAEQNGEAWYIYPPENKRYFLGRPADAFAVMRHLGLGITNNDLAKIPTTQNNSNAIAQDNTETTTNNLNTKRYNDIKNRFSLDYPKNWKIKRPNNNVIFLGDYKKDPFLEKRGLIIVSYVKTTKNTTLNNFSIATKDGANKKPDKNLKFNGQEALQQEFNYAHINNTEITTTIELSPHEYMQLILTTTADNLYYRKIYNNILQSIKKSS